MLAAHRRTRILSELEREGSVRVSELVRVLGVSDMTIRRDLGSMERDGLLAKVHGGAVLQAIPSAVEPGFEAKSQQQTAEKEAIAARAALLIEPGSAIAISAGTTTHALARHLVGIANLTVVTNSVWVADVLHRSANPNLNLLLTGGLRTPSDALVGSIAISALRSLNLDAVFLGVHGMETRAGFTTPNLLEAETNRAMIASGRQLIVLADHTKWGVVGLSSMAELADAAVVITDNGLPTHADRILSETVDELITVVPTTDSPHVPPGH